MSSLSAKMTIYFTKKPQVSLLLVEKIFIQVKYLDFTNIFLKKLVDVLPNQIKAKKHKIELKKASNHYITLFLSRAYRY